MAKLIPFLFALAACASQPRVYPLPALGVDVVHADPGSVKKVCENDRAIACAKTDKLPCEIWVGWGAERYLLHELRHCERGLAGERDDTHDPGRRWNW